MDRLGMCMDELRVLARSNDPDRAVLVEAYSTPILLPRQSVCCRPWSASRHGTPPANSRMLIAFIRISLRAIDPLRYRPPRRVALHPNPRCNSLGQPMKHRANIAFRYAPIL